VVLPDDVYVTARRVLTFYKGGGDLLYLPRTEADTEDSVAARVVVLLRLMSTCGLFMEIGIPSALWFTVTHDDVYRLRIAYNWASGGPHDLRTRPADLQAYHPLKLNSHVNMHLLGKLLEAGAARAGLPPAAGTNSDSLSNSNNQA
jgi:hypothetical protein